MRGAIYFHLLKKRWPSFTVETPMGTLLRGEATMNRKVEKNAKLMLIFSATSSDKSHKCIPEVAAYVASGMVFARLHFPRKPRIFRAM